MTEIDAPQRRERLGFLGSAAIVFFVVCVASWVPGVIFGVICLRILFDPHPSGDLLGPARTIGTVVTEIGVAVLLASALLAFATKNRLPLWFRTILLLLPALGVLLGGAIVAGAHLRHALG